MKRMLTILGLVALALVLQAGEVGAGAGAIDTYGSFTGPAFNATAVINADGVNTSAEVPAKGTVAIKLTKGNVSAGVLFVSGYVGGFQNGCDGTLGAFTPSGEGVEAKTNARFLGTDWLPNDEKTVLLAPFGITPDPFHPLVFSDISNAVCTQVEGVWILSFTGTMQFGKKLQ